MQESHSDGRVDHRIEDGLGCILFNNLPRRNAMNLAMWRQLADAAQHLSNDNRVRVIVLRGAGEEAFVSGADISEFEAARANAESEAAYNSVTQAAFDALERAPKPVIALIQGFCFGGGLAIAMKADLRLACENALFCIPAARLGIAYPGASIRDLTALVGPARAKDMLFAARRLDAQEALRIGLVNSVWPMDDWEAQGRRFCKNLIANAPLSMLASKNAVDHFSKGAPDRSQELMRMCFDSADYAEGRTAFMEKRSPVFRGF